MIVVSAGSGYLDIDAFACCFAYARMMNHLGIPAVIRTTVLGNETVVPGLLTEDFALVPMKDKRVIYMAPSIEVMACKVRPANTAETVTGKACSAITEETVTGKTYSAITADAPALSYAIMDVSEPAYFEPFVNLDQVSAVIDHHAGYHNFWKERIGDRARIEFIGAAVTLVYEEMEQNQALACIDAPLARLMMAAILDNTLNFTAGVTSERDHRAYEALLQIAGDTDFPKTYFTECQEQIEAALIEAIQGDMKYITGEIYPGLPSHIGQLAVWDVATLLARREEMLTCLRSYGKEWMINLISLKENKSYILAEDSQVKENLERRIGGSFVGDQMILDKALLRKEIKKLFAIAE